MSEEEILLAAILANRDDDAPRLAYADWLQENGFDFKAEFIRLDCQYRQAKMKLNELQQLQLVDSEWMSKVAGYGSIILLRCAQDRFISTVKLIREVTGCGLREGKTLAEATPSIIVQGVTFETGQVFLKRFRDIGAAVELRYGPTE